MIATVTQFRSFNKPAQLLMINQLTINIGFYMLMPYLAGYLSEDLNLATWTVGLVLGMRNLSQQGLFLVGGSLADRVGYKPMILAGLALRVLGFALLAFASSLPTLLLASALTGMAGALFNPSVRAYLSHEAGHRKVEAFATFNVFYQAGILLGPLLGIAILGFSFQVVCLVAAVLFAALLVAQSLALPTRQEPTVRSATKHPNSETATRRSMLGDWRMVVANQPFLLFSLAMIGSYVLNFQVYLGLPLEVRRATGGAGGVTVLFVLSGVLTITCQVRLTAWVRKRWTPAQAIQRGLTLMSLAFIPIALGATLPTVADTHLSWWTYAGAIAPVLASTSILTVATMVVYPFEMATIVDLSGGTMIGTYYGLYNTVAGIGIAAGNLLTGAALDAGRAHGLPALPWIALTGTGLLCAGAITALHRTGRLTAPGPSPKPPPSSSTASSNSGAVTAQPTTPR